MRTLAGLTSILMLLGTPALAAAQKKEPKPAAGGAPADPAKPKPGAGTEVEMGEDEDNTPIADETGMEENPDAPRPGSDGGTSADVMKRAPAAPAEYPVELARRPITLHAGMSEALLEYPVYFDPFRTAGQLRAAYGITPQIEIQLRYGIGSYSNDDSKYYPGKAVAIGGVYQLRSFIGLQLEVPILMDPFAMGVTLGAPLKFRFSKFALFVGRDLISFKIAKLLPVVEDALATEARVQADRIGTEADVGALRILGGIHYTYKPKMTITGEAGYVANDFAGDDPDKAAMLIRIGLTMNSKRLDYGARVGIDDMDDAAESVNLALFAALRI